MAISTLAAHNYVLRGGITCPYCGSAMISGEDCDFNAGEMYQNIGCNACSSRWTDKYVLTNILESQEE